MRAAATGLITAGAIALAGCGGGATPTGSGAGSSAGFVPGGATLYAEASTDLASPQWQMTIEIAKRFPSFDRVIERAKAEMAKESLDFDRDIKPLLGDTVSVAVPRLTKADLTRDDAPVLFVVDLADGKGSDTLALLQRRLSPEKVGTFDGADIYADRGSSDTYWTVVDDAIVAASARDLLESALTAHRNGSTMAKSSTLATAFAALPKETVAQAFVDFGAIVNLAGEGGENVRRQLEAAGIAPDSTLAASISAEPDGVRLKTIATKFGTAAQSAASFTPTLTKKVPSSAIAYLGVANLFEATRRSLEPAAAQDPEVRTGLQQARGALALAGVTVDDLKVLFSGEAAVMVTPSANVAAVTGVFETTDGARAARILDTARSSIAGLANGQIPPFTPVQLANGVSGWSAAVDPDASLVYGVDGASALVGSDAGAIREAQQPKSSLMDNAAFRSATQQMPAKVNSLIWLNGDALWTAIEAEGGFKDMPAEAQANLRPIRNLAAWGTDGDMPTFEAFITIK